MIWTVEDHARNILKQLKGFEWCSDAERLTHPERIGLYRNSANEPHVVEVTQGGLRFGESTELPFGEVIQIVAPEKGTGKPIVLWTSTNSFEVHIRRSNGRFEEVYEFVRFLVRVCASTGKVDD
jgi:hypothetical protein